MGCTVTVSDSYELDLGSGSGTVSFAIAEGSAGTEILSTDSDGIWEVTGDLEFRGPIHMQQRSHSAPILSFQIDNGTATANVAVVDIKGRLDLSHADSTGGIALPVDTALPTAPAPLGSTRLLDDSGTYYIIAYLGGAWRKFELPN